MCHQSLPRSFYPNPDFCDDVFRFQDISYPLGSTQASDCCREFDRNSVASVILLRSELCNRYVPLVLACSGIPHVCHRRDLSSFGSDHKLN